MNIIDMHTHTFPDKIAAPTLEKLSKMSKTIYFSDGTENGLISSMKKAGVTYSVILPVATNANQVEKINSGVIEQSAVRKEKGIISFGAMHPLYEDPFNEIKRLKDAGIAGIKLHPAYVSLEFDDPAFTKVLEAAEYFDMAITVHAGIDIGIPHHNFCTPQMILNVLERYPKIKLILAHMGGWCGWEDVKKYLAGSPLYFDTSFSYGPLYPREDVDKENMPKLMTEEEFVKLVNCIGSDKILFGTDSPWSDQKEDVNRFINLPLSDSDKSNILFYNAKKVLHI